ncbi:MAG TPA: glycosyltransferase, partial [Nitrolancea sp.]|nr:glycosyltransferase [Nitrolancea sp.]
MRSTTQVLYLGTYERDYPRNRLMIAALRHAGCDVVELHAPIWSGAHDKTALLASPRALARLGLNLASAYSRLLVRTLRRISHADIVCFGYIGQLDLLMLGPLARLSGKPIVFNPLVTLSDTLIEDRRKFAPQSLPARMIRLIDRLSLALADIILVDTAENGDYLTEEFGISPERIHTVPVGADETLFTMSGCRVVSDDSIAADTRANENQPASGGCALSVLFYGTMIPLQGADTIVRAAALVRDEGIRFEIIGSGQTYSEVRALADRLGATNI